MKRRITTQPEIDEILRLRRLPLAVDEIARQLHMNQRRIIAVMQEHMTEVERTEILHRLTSASMIEVNARRETKKSGLLIRFNSAAERAYCRAWV